MVDVIDNCVESLVVLREDHLIGQLRFLSELSSRHRLQLAVMKQAIFRVLEADGAHEHPQMSWSSSIEAEYIETFCLVKYEQNSLDISSHQLLLFRFSAFIPSHLLSSHNNTLKSSAPSDTPQLILEELSILSLPSHLPQWASLRPP